MKSEKKEVNKKSTARCNRTDPIRHPPLPTTGRHEKSIAQRRRKIKRNRTIIKIIAVMLFLIGLISIIIAVNHVSGSSDDTEEPDTPVCYFTDEYGSPVDMEHMTDAWAAEAGVSKRYNLTDAERYEVAQVVTAEAGGEPYAGMIAVAQCILQSAEDDGIRPADVLTKYGYTWKRPKPTKEAINAVSDVFDLGHVVTHAPIKFFYNPDMVESAFHESQIYIMTINNHKFYKEEPGQ